MASSSCFVGDSAPDRVIGELTRGRQIADRLRLILRQTDFNDSADSARALVTQLLHTFSHSLAMLRDGAESDEVSQPPPSLVKSEDSGDNYKTPPAKDRRGCYKRKRDSDTTIKETTNLLDDGHAWRKYGQKVILNAKHPRNYFRCTHKYEQGCQASKQVQMIKDDPPLYRTTYIGSHTCKYPNPLLKTPHHIIIDATPPDSSTIWTFGGLKPHKSSLLIDSIKQEEDVQIESGRTECYLLPELTGLDDHLTGFSTGSDQGDGFSSDVYSCTASTRSSVDDMVSIEEFLNFKP